MSEGEFDFAASIGAQVNLAELLWAYYSALMNSGFSEQAAMALVISYQALMLGRVAS